MVGSPDTSSDADGDDTLAPVREAARRYRAATEGLEEARAALRAAIVTADQRRGGRGRNELVRASEPYSRPKVYEVLGASGVREAAQAALEGVLDSDRFTLRDGPGGTVRLWVTCRDANGEYHFATAFELAPVIENALAEQGLLMLSSEHGHTVEETLVNAGEIDVELARSPGSGRWPGRASG